MLHKDKRGCYSGKKEEEASVMSEKNNFFNLRSCHRLTFDLFQLSQQKEIMTQHQPSIFIQFNFNSKSNSLY